MRCIYNSALQLLLFILQFIFYIHFLFLSNQKQLSAYMLLILSILIFKSALAFNTTIQKISLSQSVYEFGSNWAIDYEYTYSNRIVNQIIIRYINGSVVNKAKDYGRIEEIVGPTQLANQSNFVFFTASSRKLKLYKFVNNSFQILPNSSNSYFKAVVGKNNFIYTISTDKQKLLKISSETMRIENTISFSGQQAIDIDLQQKLVIMTKSSSSSRSNCPGKFYLYDQNLQMIKKLNFSGYDFTQHRNIKYDSITNSVVRASTSSVHLWNFDSTRLVKSVLKVAKTKSNNIQSSLLCNGYLIVLESLFFSFYRLEDWVKVNTTGFSRRQKIRRLKCFRNEKKVGFYSQTSSFGGIKQINYILFQEANIPNLVNAPEDFIPINISVAISSNFTFNDSQLTNQSYFDTDSFLISDEVVQDTLNQSQKVVIKTEIKGLTKEVVMAILSNASKSGASVVSSASGVTSCSSMGKPLLRPVLNLLQDLWFYKYHQIVYPQIVNLFSTQIDILNQLRIKPQFLQTQISIEKIQQQNERIHQISILQARAPDKIFMLQSSKDIYTMNLLLVFCSFLLINFLQFLVGYVRQTTPILQILYCFLVAHSKWWTILIGFFESNIVPIAFYSAIQFNVFVSFDIFTKCNNVYTILIFFCIFVFSFAFYPVVYQYGRKQQTEELFEFCQISQKSFWLEMTLKCLRGFFQAIFHGFFINRNIIQLSCLIFLDLALLFAVIRFCKKFVRIINFVLLALYFLIFLAFDCTLFSFSWQKLSQAQITSNSIDQYNFALLILILCLLCVTALRILAFLGISLWKAITNCKRTNQIQNEIEAQKIGKKQKKSGSNKTKGNHKDQILELDQNLSRRQQTRQKIGSQKQPQKVGNSKKKLNIRGEKSLKGSNMQITFMKSKNEVDQISQKTTKIGTKKVNVQRKRIGTHTAGLKNFKKSNKIQASDLIMQENQDMELGNKNTKEKSGKILTTFRYKSKDVKTIYKVNL